LFAKHAKKHKNIFIRVTGVSAEQKLLQQMLPLEKKYEISDKK